ncbi:hypothetical protein [Methanofollis liminatans]|uniref:hypothetical protein n=1 Tax=Methanofollis liminatans TaxID=2201 RepID=UPI0012F6B3AD|nr:hypothetical protein [Methanofollis liminatans]
MAIIEIVISKHDTTLSYPGNSGGTTLSPVAPSTLPPPARPTFIVDLSIIFPILLKAYGKKQIPQPEKSGRDSSKYPQMSEIIIRALKKWENEGNNHTTET